MALLIDTSVLVGLERRRGTGSPLAGLAVDEPVFLCAVIAGELLVGVELAESPSRRAARASLVEGLLDPLPILPFDLAAARRHAIVASTLRRQGQTIGAHDLIIAATALSNGLGVLTDNPGHFGRVQGLTVVRPAW